MHAYLLALEVEPIEVGKVYVALPLHCTVLHWFRSHKTPAEVLRAVADIANRQAPIEIISGEPALFGVDEDVPVNRLDDDDDIRSLHRALRIALQPLGVVDVQPQWSGEGYVPHVTRQSSGRFEQGRRVVSRKLYIVEALVPEELQQKKVVSKLILKGSDE